MHPAFDTLVINMDDSPDRLQSVSRHLAAAGLPFTRVPGLHGQALPPSLREMFFDGARPATRLKLGEIGCFAAHLSVFEGMVAGRYGGTALVLEDDCEPPPDLGASIASVLRVLPTDWDIVRLCNTPKRAYVPLAPLPAGRRLIRYSRVPNYAGAYLVRLSGARKLLQNGRQAVPFDEYLRRPWLHGCSTYGVWPPLVTQRLDLPSRIDAEGQRHAGPEAPLSKAARKLDIGNLGRRVVFNIRTLGFGRWLGCATINGSARLLRRRLGRALLHGGSALLASRS